MTRQNSVSFRLDSGNYESWGPYRPASKDFSALLTHACDSLAVLLAWFPVQSLVRWMDRTECHSSQPVAQQQALLLLQSPSSAKQRGLDSWQGSMSSIRPQPSEGRDSGCNSAVWLLRRIAFHQRTGVPEDSNSVRPLELSLLCASCKLGACASNRLGFKTNTWWRSTLASYSD